MLFLEHCTFADRARSITSHNCWKTFRAKTESRKYRTKWCREVSKTLAAEIRFLLFSGTDTTAYTATRLLQRLAKHPQWLDALWDEQQRLMAEYGEELDRRVRF